MLCAVGAIAAGCGEDGSTPDIGIGGTSGATGASGTGGAGFEKLSACPTDEAAFADLSYTNPNRTFVGREALHEISTACISLSCGDELTELFRDNTEVARSTYADCLEVCTTWQAPEVLDFPEGCVACFAAERACDTAFCAGPCATVGCEFCLCENNCPQEFQNCTGFPSRTTCPPERDMGRY